MGAEKEPRGGWRQRGSRVRDAPPERGRARAGLKWGRRQARGYLGLRSPCSGDGRAAAGAGASARVSGAVGAELAAPGLARRVHSKQRNRLSHRGNTSGARRPTSALTLAPPSSHPPLTVSNEDFVRHKPYYLLQLDWPRLRMKQERKGGFLRNPSRVGSTSETHR